MSLAEIEQQCYQVEPVRESFACAPCRVDDHEPTPVLLHGFWRGLTLSNLAHSQDRARGQRRTGGFLVTLGLTWIFVYGCKKVLSMRLASLVTQDYVGKYLPVGGISLWAARLAFRLTHFKPRCLAACTTVC